MKLYMRCRAGHRTRPEWVDAASGALAAQALGAAGAPALHVIDPTLCKNLFLTIKLAAQAARDGDEHSGG